ncbi:MAG: hypothetical protein WCF19_08285 [Chlamydiales bacterium]
MGRNAGFLVLGKNFLVIFAAMILAWEGLQYWPIIVHIKGKTPEENFSIRMPLKDKRRLEYFFRDVCFLNAWAYTLIGSKPMSIHQYRKPWAAVQYFLFHPELKDMLLHCFWPPKFREICFFCYPEHLRIKLGWEALNKYAPYISNSRFALYTYPSKYCECLAIIDKKKFIKIIERYPEDFQEILQQQVAELGQLFDDKNLYPFVKRLDHDGLIGTVLGFGRENAWLFKKSRELNNGEWPLTSPWEEFDDAHLEALDARDRSFLPWDISDLYYPVFACDPNSEETRQLKQAYRREREEIIKYYEEKDVVEATLSLLNR